MLKFAKAVSANTDLLTAQSFVFRSQLAILISGSGDDVFVKVRQTTALTEEQFFSSEGPTSLKIQSTVQFLQDQLKDISQLQILLIFFHENVLYLQNMGEHKAFIYRDGKISELTSQVSSGKLISGFIKEGDRLLFISSRLTPISSRLTLISSKPAQDGEDKKEEEWDFGTVSGFIKAGLDNFSDEIEAFLQENGDPVPLAAIIVENTKQEVQHETFDVPRKFNLLPKNNLFVGLNEKILPVIVSFIVRTISFLKTKKKITLICIIALVLFAGAFIFFKNRPSRNETASIEPQKLEEKKTDPSIKNISEWPLFLSLDLIKDNFSPKKLSFSIKKLLLLDSIEKTLVVVDTEKKTNEILAGNQQLGEASSTSLNGQTAFVYSEDKGIVRVDIASKKAVVIIKPDNTWGQIVDIFGFSGNIYLLDKTENQVWKYVPVPSGYSDKFLYLKQSGKVDFLGSTRLQIDYSVWVLKQGPEILKFTGGASDFFSPEGLDKPIGESKSFFVTEEEDAVYILDPENSRIVILQKNGRYRSQLIGEKFKTADDFVVDEESKKLYLLEGNKIYQIELQ